MARDSLPHFPAPGQAPPAGYQSPYSPTQASYGGSQPPYQAAPPQVNYGYGNPPAAAPPPGAAGYRPGVYNSRPQMPPNADPQLWSLFTRADTNGTGQLSEQELAGALVNGDYRPFDGKTVKLMVKMFDVDQNGTVGFNEFEGLWKYLAQWRQLFERFDRDRSGYIEHNEFRDAVSSFGYRLTDKFVHMLFVSYDRGERPAPPQGSGQISFDLFVQSMVTLKTLTEVFKQMDTDRDGYITIGFEQFLEVILRQR